MKQLRAWLLRLGGYLHRNRQEKDLAAEMESHLQLHIEDNLRAGMSRAQARREALMKLGGVEQTKEIYRDRRGLPLLETTLQDLRFAARTLLKNPGFASVAILTLALGIGTNSAIFSLVDSTLLRALPFSKPAQLVRIWTTEADGEIHTPSPTEYLALSKSARSFDEITGLGWADYFFGSDQSAWQNISGFRISSNWLTTLGVQPYLGRNFVAEEQEAGRDNVAILSFQCWRRRFNADPHIVGQHLALNRRDFIVVGVLPETLSRYYDADIFAPLVLSSYTQARGRDKARVQIVARLKPGVTLDQARAEISVFAQQLRASRPPTDPSGHLTVQQFTDDIQNLGPTARNAQRGLWMMLAGAGLVLLIASANVSSLLLTRAVKRRKEIAVRAALGCSRPRMIRQLLTECALLFLCGGSFGVLVARWSEDVLMKAIAGLAPNGAYVNINARVFLFSLGVSFLCALAFGLAPALQATRIDLNDSLKDAAPARVSGFRSRRSRNLLVVSEVSLGMVLLVGFGLLLRSFLHVESVAMGYDPANVLTASVGLSTPRYQEPSARLHFLREAVERARLMPGVVSAGMTETLPLDGADSGSLILENHAAGANEGTGETRRLSVDSEFFPTMKFAMLAGRLFNDNDSFDSAAVVIVNQTFANQFFPNQNPLGRRFAFTDSPMTWREIVGVISNVRQRNLDEDSRPIAYLPLAQSLPRDLHLAIRVRASADMAPVSRDLTNWLRPLDQDLYWEQSTMLQRIHDSESVSMRRPVVTLLALFGGLALLLALVGVFSVTSFSVTERTREIGIRIALGAARSEVAALVLKETLFLTMAGLASGALAALVLTQLLPTGPLGWSGSGISLFGVSGTDFLTYSCSSILLSFVALSACYIPARRAMRVDPLVALRYK
jgi:putative ABC transport system permease protein